MRLILATLTVFTLLSGCSVVHSLPQNPVPAVRQDVTLDELIRLLQRRDQDLQSMKALIHVQAGMEDGVVEFFGTLFFQRPDALRLKGHDFMGQTLFDLVARGEDVQIYLPREDRLLADQIALPLSLGHGKYSLNMVDLLEVLGASSGVGLDPAYLPALEKNEEAYLIHLFTPQGSRAVLYKKLWLEPLHYRLVREEIFDPSGSPRVEILFEEYRQVETRWHPQRVRATVRNGPRFTLSFKEIVLNPVLTEKDFSLPAGANLSSENL